MSEKNSNQRIRSDAREAARDPRRIVAEDVQDRVQDIDWFREIIQIADRIRA
jgi:hypothetical protein